MDILPEEDPRLHSLGMWDAVSLIVGIVVGVGIFETPPLIFATVNNAWVVIGLWALAGFLCLLGALCYAELATTYPGEGGDYAYLIRAFGRWVGFLYGWSTIAIIVTGNIGMMVYIFADYGNQFLGMTQDHSWILASLPILILTSIHLLGVRAGKRTQNGLTLVKIVGVTTIILAGLFWPSADHGALSAAESQPFEVSKLSLALVLILFTYGGWNDSAYIVAELRDGRRAIPRALILGVSAVILIYVLINLAYLRGLGYEGASHSRTIAADVLKKPLGESGQRLMGLLVMISALGTANGLIITGSRVSLFLGRDHALFGLFGRRHGTTGTPTLALVGQALLTLFLVLLVGTDQGRSLLEFLFRSIGLPPESSLAGSSGFNLLLKCTTPIFWLFFFLTGLSLILLRHQDAERVRPFPVPGYPLTPVIFCATCLFMLYSSIDYAKAYSLVGLGLLLPGFPLYLLSQSMHFNRKVPK